MRLVHREPPLLRELFGQGVALHTLHVSHDDDNDGMEVVVVVRYRSTDHLEHMGVMGV